MNAAIYLQLFFFCSFCVGLFLFLPVFVAGFFLLFFFLFFLFSGGLVFSLIVSVETQSVTISWRYVWFLAPNCIMLYRHLQHHNDTIIKTQEDFFIKIFTSHFIARVRKDCVGRELETTETAIFWPPLLWPATLCLSRSPDSQPEALGSTLLGDGFLYCILSASSLDLNSSGPQAPSAWCGFPYHISSITSSPTVIGTGLELNCLDFCLDWVI